MPRTKKYVCNTCPDHIFDGPSDSGFCFLEPFGHGMLFEKIVNEDETPPTEDTGTGGREVKKDDYGQKTPPPTLYEKEIGLCVLLMDASSSMTDPAFEGNPVTKMHLAAVSAATGIFDLERMQNNPNAYVAAFKFDDRVKPMFVESVGALIKKYNGNVREFAGYIHDELFTMQQGTDINKALDTAYTFVGKFLNRDLPDFGGMDYTPLRQVIIRAGSAASVSIPNVRVMIYTDGMQYDSNKDRHLKGNPFVRRPLPGLNHDVVIGAFFGKSSDEGCRELKSLLSNCPIHEVPQFFLFDTPDNVGNLKTLFRMASGASGFCPRCLERELRR